MIYNERQYKITGKQIEDLTASLAEIENIDQPEWLFNAQVDALRSQINDLESQVAEYGLLKEGNIHFSECSDLTSLPRILIQSRIGKGLSQRELAEILGMSAQQIQRYEATNYMGASLTRLIEISEILEVTITEAWGGKRDSSNDAVYIWQDMDAVDWSMFPVKEMIKRGWVELEHKKAPAEIIRKYFSKAAGSQFATAMHRKKFHGGNKPNEYSLLAWQARILERSRKTFDSGFIADFEYNDSWVSELVKLSREDTAPLLAKEFLASKGIILIIEEHLQGTYLDGAAMLLETGNPVIGLTLRYDRLDNFWFVLFHELGHIFLHLFESLHMDFFDEEGGEGTDDIEREADNFALNALIPENQWNLCMSRFSMSEESIEIDSSNLNLHPSIIAGRIRKEANNFTIFSNLVGQNLVRHLFGEDA
jgi:HTH-type transcriptional regulator / antitoxin HigA